MFPPAPSTVAAISPTPRFSVPLKSMCSWTCAIPHWSGRSSALPVRTQTFSATTGAEWSSTRMTLRPLSSVVRSIPSFPMAAEGAWPVPVIPAHPQSTAARPVAMNLRKARPPPAGRGAHRIRSVSRGTSDADLGVYIHVPFCETVCPYCDFAVVGVGALAERDEEELLELLLQEWGRWREALAGRPLASVYFGGGTPSLLRAKS